MKCFRFSKNQIFKITLKTPIVTLQGHREAISGVEWINEDSILTSSWDHTLKIWDLNLGGIKSEISGNKSFFDMSYSKINGMIITASADKSLRLYDPRSIRKFYFIFYFYVLLKF